MLQSFRLTEDSFTIRLSKVLKLLKSYMIVLMFNDTWQPSTTAIMEISFNAWPMWNKLPKMIDTCILITPFMLEKWKSRSSHNFWNHIEGKFHIEFMDKYFFALKEFCKLLYLLIQLLILQFDTYIYGRSIWCYGRIYGPRTFPFYIRWPIAL